MSDRFPYQVTIMWGSCPEEGDLPKTYSFETEAERNAFMTGVSEAEGWHGYTEIEEGSVYCFECNAAMIANESGTCSSCDETDYDGEE